MQEELQNLFVELFVVIRRKDYEVIHTKFTRIEILCTANPTVDLTSFVLSKYESFEKLKLSCETGKRCFTPVQNLWVKTQCESVYLLIKYDSIVERAKAEVRADFNQFVQGITFFQHHHHTIRNGRNRGRPINPLYHRDLSCGPKGVASSYWANNFDCSVPGLSIEEKERRKNRIITCFVERMIWNAIYSKKFGVLPDIGHSFHVREKLDDLLRSCTDYEIKVKIKFSSTKKPKQLTIIHISHQNTISSSNSDTSLGTYQNQTTQRPARVTNRNNVREKEIYLKITDTDVQCTKIVFDTNVRIIELYRKNQSFSNESNWTLQV